MKNYFQIFSKSKTEKLPSVLSFYHLGVKSKKCPQIAPRICISNPGLPILLLTQQWHGIHTTAKGGFYSERAAEFAISPNRRTKLFS